MNEQYQYKLTSMSSIQCELDSSLGPKTKGAPITDLIPYETSFLLSFPKVPGVYAR
jgi:hypothetical protein